MSRPVLDQLRIEAALSTTGKVKAGRETTITSILRSAVLRSRLSYAKAISMRFPPRCLGKRRQGNMEI